jgi:ribonucleoside-diphosphate reductase alpha chain
VPFKLEGFSEEIFKKRYAICPDETWEQACERVSMHVAMAEEGGAIKSSANDFYDELVENRFMPGGRIWYGSGRAKGQLLNCFAIPTSDSREGWGKTVSDVIVISGTGGGVGINFSPIRPRGTPVHGTGGSATGAVSLMQIIDAAGDVLKAGGGRRTALLFGLAHDHGDIVEFLDKKLDLKQLTNANVSIAFVDEEPEQFFAKVKADEQHGLKFAGRTVKTVPAREIWDRAIENMLKGGEPGFLNIAFMNRMSNIAYYKPIICTNPCGEVGLIEYDACCLGSLVLPRFISDKGNVNFKQLEQTIKVAVRFLDDVLTVNSYPLPKIGETVKGIRRLGLGVMGLHDMVLLKGLRYDSAEGLEFVDSVMRFIKNRAYEASIELAKEKGPFAKFEPEKFLKGGFAKAMLKPTIRTAIEKHGIRNCALLTIPPTGTTSIVCRTSSGIEPIFAPAYERRWFDGDTRKTEVVVHPLFQQFIEEGRDVSHFVGAHDISLKAHFEMQRCCQRHVDNAVSKTINIPQGTSKDVLSDLLIEYLPELKGVTVYPDGSRENQPLTPLSIEQAMSAAGDRMVGAAPGSGCRGGTCDV